MKMEDETLEELKTLVRKRKWIRNTIRINLGGDTVVRNGWKHLKQGVFSNTERQGRILELCREMLGQHITEVCCNRNVVAGRHKDKRNEGESYFLMFGDFEGGALLIDEPEGLRRIEEKDTWYIFHGQRDFHWNEPITSGDKYSLVCFARKPPHFTKEGKKEKFTPHSPHARGW